MITLIISLLILIPFGGAYLALRGNHKYYKKVYNQLPKTEFEWVLHLLISKDRKIVWFTKDNDFKLFDDIYLVNNWTTYLDPYSYYWLRKYQKYFSKYGKV